MPESAGAAASATAGEPAGMAWKAKGRGRIDSAAILMRATIIELQKVQMPSEPSWSGFLSSTSKTASLS